MWDGFDAVTLARAQFAFTMSFHIIFPGLLDRACELPRGARRPVAVHRPRGLPQVFRYWLKIFAIAFGMGVVSGIVMSYQFGTNWAVFADKAGPIIGPLMAYEVLTAFFLEAGFLGVMLFGMERVGKGLHFTATLLVAIGTAISAFWILSVNSWMQTPQGYAINEAGQFVPDRLVEDHLQPVVSISARAHGHRRLSDDGAGGRRRGAFHFLTRRAARAAA